MSAKFPPPQAPWQPGRRIPRNLAASARGKTTETLAQTLPRRLRDLLVMAVVGPLAGVAALSALQFAASHHAVPGIALVAEPTHVATVAAPASVTPAPAVAPTAAAPMPPEPPAPATADFGAVTPTPDARHMADWIVSRRDNGKLPFVVLDKRAARLYVFQPGGQLVEDTPVLLGSSHGDDTYPGIGDVPISQVKPYQRTTAAGRFVTQPGLDIDRTDVVWLDYNAALAMHRVINKVKAEHRLQHLASPDPAMRRISWGCINIPIDFFDRNISPVFGKHPGVAYVIPETKTFAQVFEHEAGATPAVAVLGDETRAPKDVGGR